MNNAKSGQTTSIHSVNPFHSIALAWLVAGTLDITVASIYFPLVYHISLMGLYQGIASGVLGVRAFSGGIATAVLGLACHYFIAFIWTVIFFLVYPKIGIMSKNRFITGIFYAVFVSCVMSFVVLPLSNDPNGHHPVRFLPFVISTVILMFTIGTPISMIIGNYYSGKRNDV